MAGLLTAEVFDALRGPGFEARAMNHEILRLELADVESGRGGHEGFAASFSLIFRGAAEPVFAQATYLMSHSDLGEFELFLVPIGPDEHGMRYEAVFG